MKVFLVSAPSDTQKLQHRPYPLGIAYLGAILENAKHETKLFDYFNAEMDKVEEEFIRMVKEEKPNVIGFSILSMNRTASFDLIKRIKSFAPETKIIAGGVHCSVLYEQLLKNFPIEAICLGEGENVVTPLVESIFDKKALKDVKGIAYMDENGNIAVTPAPEMTKLDDVPFPKHDVFLTDKSKTLYMITSRGCAGRCVFCSTTSYWKIWRTRSPKNVVDEIESVKKRFPNIDTILFLDDAFTLDNNRAINICKEIINRGIKVKWTCQARVTPISMEMLEWLKKAGCTEIAYGVESGSDRMLQEMKKYITSAQIITAFDLTRKVGIIPDPYLMIGLPSESNETINETIALLKRIKCVARSVAILELYPNTEIYRIAKAQGFITDDYWLTDKPIPIYTYEHSLPDLQRMVFKIVYESQKNAGWIPLFEFGIKQVLAEPRRVLSIINTMRKK